MTTYQRLIEHRDWCLRIGGLVFGVALVLSFMPSIKVPASGMIAMLGLHCFMAYNFLDRISRLQSALDMKRIMRGETPE